MIDERQAVVVMALLRGFAGVCELSVAAVIWGMGSVKLGIRLNAFLGMLGPIVFFLAMLVGVGGLVGRAPWWRLACVVAGLALVIVGLGE